MSNKEEIEEKLKAFIDTDGRKVNKRLLTAHLRDSIPLSRAIKKDNLFTLPFSAKKSSYKLIRNLGEFTSPEYDLFKVGILEDLESFVARAFERRISLVFKQGYSLVGTDKKALDYVKTRIAQIEDISDTPFDIILHQLASDIVKKSNAFLIKDRKDQPENRLVTPFNRNGKRLNPINSLVVLPPELSKYKLSDELFSVAEWLFDIGNGITKDASDVIHMFVNKKTGFVYGTPRIVPAENDIESLRKVEQNIETLIYLFVFPIIWYAIEDGDNVDFDLDTELVKARDRLEGMMNDGGIVTGGGDKVDILTASGTLNYSDYMQHLKARVYTGLGMSSVDMGQGDTSNRATATTMSRALMDSVKADQRAIESFINFYLFKDLLREKRSKAGKTAAVKLVFKEIDVDTLIKSENHAAILYGNDLITVTEAREKIGSDPLTKQQESLLRSRFSNVTNNMAGAANSVANPTNQFTKNSESTIKLLDAYLNGAIESGREITPDVVATAVDSVSEYYKLHRFNECDSALLNAKIEIALPMMFTMGSVG